MQSSLLENFTCSKRTISQTFNFISKTQSLVSLHPQQNQSHVVRKRFLKVLSSDITYKVQRNLSHDFYVSKQSQRQTQFEKTLANKIHYQQRQEIQTIFKQRKWMRKLQIEDKISWNQGITKKETKETQLKDQQFDQTSNSQTHLLPMTDQGIFNLKLDSDQDEYYINSQENSYEQDNQLQKEGGIGKNQLRLGIIGLAEISIDDESVEEMDEPQLPILSLGLNSLEALSSCLSTKSLESDNGNIQKNINRKRMSFESEVESLMLEQISQTNNLDFNEEEDYPENTGLKILNFENLFSDEIHQDDFISYEFQDNIEVSVKFGNDRHLNIKGIIKQPKMEEEEDSEKEEGIEVRMKKKQPKIFETQENIDAAQVFSSKGKEQRKDRQNSEDLNSSILSIELLDENSSNQRNQCMNEFANYKTFNTCKTVHFDEEPKVQLFIKNQRCLGTIDMGFDVKKSDILVNPNDMAGIFKEEEVEDDISDDDDDDFDWLHQTDDGSTTSRNSKGPQIDVEKALFDLKLEEVKRNNNVGRSTFSMYYDRAMG